MNSERKTRISKFLSFVLRHEPEAAGITLDSAGWVEIRALLAGCAKARREITMDELRDIVATNAKKRFEFSADRLRIRASQGHSVEVDLEYGPSTPPDVLYHGTPVRFLDGIRATGLNRGGRHHAHLSEDTVMTLEVGARRGKPALLTIRAGDMHADGMAFFQSTNGVWLTEHVPSQYIIFP